jgi:hypothetical protein
MQLQEKRTVRIYVTGVIYEHTPEHIYHLSHTLRILLLDLREPSNGEEEEEEEEEEEDG